MGEQRLYFEDVSEGDMAPACQHTLKRTDFVTYAGASGDYNPMHHDEVKATQAGLPSVFGHGMYFMGLLSSTIEAYVGVGNLTRYSVRFTKQGWPGDVLTSRIQVMGKANGLVTLDVSLINQNGEGVVAGEATATLPRTAPHG